MIAYVIGTRPEAIKLAPVIEKLPGQVIYVQQHDHSVREVLGLYGIDKVSVIPVNIEKRNPAGILSRVTSLDSIFCASKPSLVVVQGDTSAALMGATAAYYAGIPVAHVEAGLRSYAKNPFPEETHRIMIDRMASYHFCPTPLDARRLASEKNIQSLGIFMVGNTGIDSLKKFAQNVEKERSILVTCHRRENWEKLQKIADKINMLSNHIAIRYMRHSNPSADMSPYLDRGVEIIEPLRYDKFVAEIAKSFLVLTDSGGLQEECPSLGVPVGILRDETERPDVIKNHAGVLLGSEYRIVTWVVAMLNDESLYAKYAVPRDLYGDGHASDRIAKTIKSLNLEREL